MYNKDIKKIAVLCRSAYGDLVINSVLLKYLKLNCDNAKITLIVDSANCQLLPYLSDYDDAIIVPAKGNNYLNLVPVAIKHRKQFELVVVSKASPSRTLNIFLYLLAAQHNCAYVDNNWHGRLVKRGVLYDKQSLGKYHQAVKLLRLIAPNIEHVPTELYPKLKLPQIISATILPTIQKNLSSLSEHPGKLLLISASSTKNCSFIGALLYNSVLNAVYSQSEFKIVISCLPKEKICI